MFLLPCVHHILMIVGRRIFTFNCLVQLPSSAAGCFAKPQHRGSWSKPMCLCLVASCPRCFCNSQPPARVCDMLDLTFPLNWPQAAQWVTKVALTLRGVYLCSFFLGFARRRSKQPDIWLHLAAVPVYVMSFFPSLYFLY